MSRIGNLAVVVPTGVKVNNNNNELFIEGPKGKLNLPLKSEVKISLENSILKVSRVGDNNVEKSLHGLYRVLINNMIIGVTKGYEKKLEISGTGFKANVQGKKIVLNLGYSHPVEYEIPEGIKITVEENTKLTIAGIDKHLVGQVAAVIRRMRPPEPYKGKGIKYAGEVIRRKAGKATKK
ncbi:MAG: 50S ribosomal protein L6 [Spirochaetes bacterium GWD1_27_9]|nr:MAG: 50S ribosomal protein L6 [Spirochaetes bacterium GWB1_27_13]OHD21035.1 MAG: 50S ribosomal protein L6 [Spirochaetes bacterium GWC1_27_15]OHD45396.1 MAG: 50S ribosomal protein L6 [Spirochaetes bacterium GWD1_27_9]